MLTRVLEPEVMDTPEEARAYDEMDFTAVNAAFVADLVAALTPADLQLARDATTPEFTPALPTSLPPTILDVGTGTARIPLEFCLQVDWGHVLAVDLSPAMLEIAQENVHASRYRDRITLRQTTTTPLVAEGARFQIVMSNSLVHHVADAAQLLRELAMLVTPGGVLFVRDLLRPETSAAIEELVNTHAGQDTPRQQQLFRQSLAASLSLKEVEAIARELPIETTVTKNSDRHWTLVGKAR